MADDPTGKVITLKSIEIAFQRKETVHKIGTDNKGTPISDKINMQKPPDILAARANVTANKNSNQSKESKLWPEKTATKRYGPQGSHPRGTCKCSWHRDTTDHCWFGCAKCGGYVLSLIHI